MDATFSSVQSLGLNCIDHHLISAETDYHISILSATRGIQYDTGEKGITDREEIEIGELHID